MDKYNIEDEFDKRINMGLCPRCAVSMKVINVHGHTQCPACHCVIDDCCQGEQAINQPRPNCSLDPGQPYSEQPTPDPSP